MREIKFRVWVKNAPNKGMYYPTILQLINGKSVDTAWGEDVKGGYKLSDDVDEMVSMQSTGLKDKNGKEIYEGDIYRTIVIGTDYGQDLVVRYNHGAFGLIRNGYTGMNPKKLASRVNMGNGYVVGNIYENPELLK